MKTRQFSYSLKQGWKNLEEAKALDSGQTLILAFCAPSFRDDEEVFKKLKENFPHSSVVGCSTSGEILGLEIHDFSLSLVALKFEQGTFKVAALPIDDSLQSEQVGRQLIDQLNAPDLKGIFIFSDGLSTNGSKLVAGINSIINKNIVVAGGLAGDGANFSHTWVLHENKIKSNTVMAVGLYGDSLHLSNASRAGWDKFGPERVITKSRGNILFEIDNHPALDLYKEYLGEKAKELPASGLLFPLQIRSSKADENRLIRTILAINEEQKSITFAGDIPEGYIAQLMKANFERVIEAANDAGEVIKKSNAKYSSAIGSEFTLAISCVGRRLVLGERAEEELEALMMALPEKSLLTGFYSYGEIGPTLAGGASDLHNQSMTIISLTETLNQANKSIA